MAVSSVGDEFVSPISGYFRTPTAVTKQNLCNHPCKNSNAALYQLGNGNNPLSEEGSSTIEEMKPK